VLIHNQWTNLWQRLPWVKGSLITLAIALPWYILAEIRTPGFLNYFIIGEHLNRFLVPGWTGDKYGIAHNAPKGMIWLYALIGLFPWSLIGGAWFLTHVKKLPFLFRDDDGWMSYWCLCLLTPLVFFTFAGNIIYPYVFPCLPAFALLFAEIWSRGNQSLKTGQWIPFVSLTSGVIFLAATLVFIYKPDLVAKTQKTLVEAWVEQHPATISNLVYWGNKTEFSAQFYSGGKIKPTHSRQELCALLSNNLENYLIVNDKSLAELPKDLLRKFNSVKTISYNGEPVLLMHCPVLSCQEGSFSS